MYAEQALEGRFPLPADAGADWPRIELRDVGARYLLQRNMTDRVSNILSTAGIRHAIIKGASVRERTLR